MQYYSVLMLILDHVTLPFISSTVVFLELWWLIPDGPWVRNGYPIPQSISLPHFNESYTQWRTTHSHSRVKSLTESFRDSSLPWRLIAMYFNQLTVFFNVNTVLLYNRVYSFQLIEVTVFLYVSRWLAISLFTVVAVNN